MRLAHAISERWGGFSRARVGGGLGWAPFGLLLAVWLARGLSGRVGLDLSSLLLAGPLWVAWLAGRRLWPLAALFALALAALAWQMGVLGRGPGAALDGAAPGTYLRLEGTVRDAQRVSVAGVPTLDMLLGEVRVMAPGGEGRLPELLVRFPVSARSNPRLTRRRVRVGGRVAAFEREGGAPRLELSGAAYHRQVEPVNPWGGEVLRAALAARAGYYLGAEPLAVFQPVLLGVRGWRSLEARRVTGVATRVGIAHLFAISGLHIGLLFFIFLGVAHLLLRWWLPPQGWLRARTNTRVGVVAVIWLYIALIGFPVPAVRAGVMGSMLVWADLWGTRTPRLYILLLAGLVLLAAAPSAIYDLSFQLSFLSYFFLVCALGLSGWVAGAVPWRDRGWAGRAWAMVGGNLWITLWITLGAWPLIALKFGQFSLLVFVGNLVMIPLLSVAVLPLGLVALVTSLAFLGQPPGGWVERAVFGVLEVALQVWIRVADLIEWAGAPLVVPVQLAWRPGQIFLYYTLLLGGLLVLEKWGRSRGAALDGHLGAGRTAA